MDTDVNERPRGLWLCDRAHAERRGYSDGSHPIDPLFTRCPVSTSDNGGKTSMKTSRLPEFSRYSVQERLMRLRDEGFLAHADYGALETGQSIFNVDDANRV